MTNLRLIFFGDVVSTEGRNIVFSNFSELKAKYNADFCIVNGENSAGGLGITPKIADEFLKVGFDCITSGNHTWKEKDYASYLNKTPQAIRPANYYGGNEGSGVFIIEKGEKKLRVINFIGQILMAELVESPFNTFSQFFNSTQYDKTIPTLIDFHAEATSEKRAFGFFVDGKASVCLGTHTHVQTADEQILPEGTAYITDVGMCGVKQSVIGADVDSVISRFTSGKPFRYKQAKGQAQLNAVFVEICSKSLKALKIERIFIDS